MGDAIPESGLDLVVLQIRRTETVGQQTRQRHALMYIALQIRHDDLHPGRELEEQLTANAAG